MRIKRKYIPILITAFVLAVMAITNPGNGHFKAFVKKELTRRDFSDTAIKNCVESIKRTNYFIFTQYSFKINDSGVLLDGKYIGAFACFVSVGNFTVDNDE